MRLFDSAWLAGKRIERSDAAQLFGRRLKRETRKVFGDADLRMWVRHRPSEAGIHRALIEQLPNGLRISLDLQVMTQPGLPHQPEILGMAPFPLALVRRARGLRAIEADFSDGGEGGPGVMSFSSRDPQAVLIPDAHFLASGGYLLFRDIPPLTAEDWLERSNAVLWRGSTTGGGAAISTPTMAPDGLLPRVRMCVLLRDVAGVDAKISSVVQSDDPALDRQRLEAAGIVDGFLDAKAWRGYRFSIDIDGNSNAWSNLFTRLLMGNCVIKVASAEGYRQWYYDRLEPWVHYVPVRSDMADLVERIAWCRDHAAECFEIARAGQALAGAMTMESEVAAAIDRLNAVGAGGA